jgi:predicted choloylglycine hydrolase
MKRWHLPVIGITLLLSVAACAQATVKIVELQGSGAEIGKAEGEQLGESIRALNEGYLKRFISGDIQRFAARSAAMLFEDKLMPEHLAEIKALSEASKMDERDTMLAQCFLDLLPSMACSTIALPADAAPDHVARLGRNLDFPSLGIADKHTVVMIFHPDGGRFGFAAVTWPGLVGVLSGMNEHGLTLCNMEVARAPRIPQAMPYTLLYRTLLERCKTVDDAIALLKKTPRQTANNLMLMDAAGDRAVVEITPATIAVRRADDHAALISTNHQRGIEADTAGKCKRYDLLHDVAKSSFGKLGPSQIETLLGRVAQGNMTLQSMVFEPSTRTIYLATGKHATEQPYERIDLSHYFLPPSRD